jgi:hypothetical protein
MPAGRPSTYPKGEELSLLIEQALDLARAGKSLAQISAIIDIPRTTMLSWADVHPEFSTTLTRAKELEQAWWEDQAQIGMTADKFNATVWSKSVSARFKSEYTERVQQDLTSTDGSMSPKATDADALDAINRRLDSIAAASRAEGDT